MKLNIDDIKGIKEELDIFYHNIQDIRRRWSVIIEKIIKEKRSLTLGNLEDLLQDLEHEDGLDYLKRSINKLIEKEEEC
jgi:hypothetical protein